MFEILLQLFVSGILAGGIYALISVGLTLVFGVLRVVNFAHGEYMMLAMYFTFWLFTQFAVDPYLAILIVLPAAWLFGIATEWLLIRRTLDAPHIVQVFVTLALSILLQNLALLSGQPISARSSCRTRPALSRSGRFSSPGRAS